MGNIYTGSNTGKAGLEVTEEDGTPDVFGVSKIIVSNGTLTDNNDGSVTIQTGGGGGGGGGTVTSVDVSGGSTGLTTSGGPITGAGTITISGVLETTNGGTGLSSIGTANQFLKVNSLGTALEYATINTGVDGSGAANQVAYWSDADTIAGDTGLTYTPTGGSRQLKITDNGVSDMFVIESTDDGATNAPDVKLYRNSTSPTTDDVIGAIKFNANEGNTGGELTYARIESRIDNAGSATYGGSLDFYITNDAAEVRMLTISGEIVGDPNMSFDVNPDGDVDGDFRHLSLGGTVNIFSDAQNRTLDIAPIKNYGFGGTATPLDGELLIGNGNTFSKANLTSTGGSITITNGAGTINLETAVAGYSGWIAKDSQAVPLTTTIDSGDTLEIAGGTGITTTLSGTGTTTPTLTIDVDGSSPTGTGAANQVTYWSGANTITGDSGLQWNPTGGSERLTVTGSSASDMLRVVSTNTGTGTAPDIAFVRDRTYTAGLDLGIILFKGPDADDAEHTYAWIQADAKDGTVGAEKGQMDFRVNDGTGANGFPLRLSDTGAHFNVVNASGLDVRMDTASQDNAFLLDASENDILTQVPFRNEIEIQSTDAGAGVAPDLKLYRNSSSPAANDVLGQVLFSGEDDASQKINYASITGFAVDVATAQPDGAIVFNCLRNGTSAPYFDIGKLVSGVRAMTVNPNSLDNDFYIKTVNQSEAFKMDGSADTATFNVPVTITVNNLDGALTVESTDSTTGSNSSPDIFVKSAKSADGDYLGAIHFQGQNSVAATTSYAKILSRIDTATDGDEAGVLFTSIPHQGTDRTFSYYEGGNGTSNGRVSFNYNAKDIDFGILNQGTADGGPGGFALFAQAETGEVGINTSSPSATLHIKIPTVASNTQGLMIESEDDGSSVGPQLILLRDSATPAVSDDIGQIRFQGKNLSATTVTYSDIYTDILDPTASSEDGRVFFRCVSNSTLSNYLTVVGTGSGQISTNFPLDIQGGLTAYEGVAPDDGQLLIGDAAGGKFDMATLTSTGGTVTITNGAGTINLEAAGGGGGTPGGAGNDIQFNNGAGGFGGSSDFTYNDSTKVLALGAALGSGVTFQQFTGLNAGGNITSNSTTFSANVNGVVALSNELGVLMETRDHQVQTGKTTTQSFGQTQNNSINTGPTDCYPSQGGMIVCSDIAGNSNQVINLACMLDGAGQFSRAANPPNVAGGGTPVGGVPDKAGYGTWQVGDQVTVLTNFAPGGSPNITILSYCGTDNGAGGSSDPVNGFGSQISINGVTTGQTITTNYTAKTFILCEDPAALVGVSWVAIG